MQTILLIGGCGYIGSHTAVELLNQGYKVVIVDDLSNSEFRVCSRIAEITNVLVNFHYVDATNINIMDEVFRRYTFDAVMLFAAKKSIKESIQKPLVYYRNNLDITLTTLALMQKYGCHIMIFSSSATVYGNTGCVPYSEKSLAGNCINPYGRTKYMAEQILGDIAKADTDFSVVALRYFNPVGAHSSGLIGEWPKNTPNNLMPIITQVAAQEKDFLTIYGNNYPTPDGTCVRDYIHVMDLAKGHINALQYAMAHTGFEVVNLGTGTGYSVLDVIKVFETSCKVKVPYQFAKRRKGDVAVCYADPKKAEQFFGWKAEKSLADMCLDAWNWKINSKIEG